MLQHIIISTFYGPSIKKTQLSIELIKAFCLGDLSDISSDRGVWYQKRFLDNLFIFCHVCILVYTNFDNVTYHSDKHLTFFTQCLKFFRMDDCIDCFSWKKKKTAQGYFFYYISFCRTQTVTKYSCFIKIECIKIPDVTIFFCPLGLQGLVETLVRQANSWCSHFKADSWGVNWRRGEPRSTASSGRGPIHSAKWCLVTSLLARHNKSPIMVKGEKTNGRENNVWEAYHTFKSCPFLPTVKSALSLKCSCSTAASMSTKDAEVEATTDEVMFHRGLFKFTSATRVCEVSPVDLLHIRYLAWLYCDLILHLVVSLKLRLMWLR